MVIQNGVAAMEKLGNSSKLKHSYYGTVTLLLGVYLTELKKYVQTQTYTGMFTAALLSMTKSGNNSRLLTDK
jgi:hypothetical protein